MQWTEGPGHDDEQPEEMPASAIFMEMMRRAAEKSPAKPAPPPIQDSKSALPTLDDLEALAAAYAPPPVKAPPAEPATVEAPEDPVIEPPYQPVSEPTETAPDVIMSPMEAIEVPALPAPEAEEAAEGITAAPAVITVPPAADAEVVSVPAPRVKVKKPKPAPSGDPRMDAQRVQRVQRRQQKRRRRNVSVLGGIVRTLLVVVPSAVLMATILSWWTDPSFLKPELRQNIALAQIAQEPTSAPTLIPTPNWARRVGIVSGHRGPGRNGEPYDPGAVCDDGLTENEINFRVASLVFADLRQRGYDVELLDEFDPRLQDYQAAALVSIHANTCADFGAHATGYIVAKAAAKPEGGLDTILADCISEHYGVMSSLPQWTTPTVDMTDYHSFREINPSTPAAIIELGFMRNDRQVLTERPDALAQGISNGILCFLEPGLSLTPTIEPDSPTPTLPIPLPGL